MEERFASGGVIERKDVDGLTPDGIPRPLMDFGCSYFLPPLADRTRKILEAINAEPYELPADH